jgi:hypothetical protein
MLAGFVPKGAVVAVVQVPAEGIAFGLRESGGGALVELERVALVGGRVKVAG